MYCKLIKPEAINKKGKSSKEIFFCYFVLISQTKKERMKIKELHLWNKINQSIFNYIDLIYLFFVISTVNICQIVTQILDTNLDLYLEMISLHLNKKKPVSDSKKNQCSGLFNFGLFQKGPSQIMNGKRQHIREEQRKYEQKSQCNHNRIVINDQNCSHQANVFQQNNQSQKKFLEDQKYAEANCVIRNSVHEKDREILRQSNFSENRGNILIDLKKKIKKSSTVNLSRNNFFRQKVTFKAKNYKLLQLLKTNQSEEESQQITMQIEQRTQQFFVYKDCEVFTGLKGQQLRKRIVSQRMDNDNQTDDEQMQKFKSIVIRQFTEYVQQVQTQKCSSQLEKSQQVIEDQ